MSTRPLRMRRITWPGSRGVKNNYIFGIPEPDLFIHYYNFGDSTMNAIKVIRENNVRTCAKRRLSFCACAKSRDLLKVA